MTPSDNPSVLFASIAVCDDSAKLRALAAELAAMPCTCWDSRSIKLYQTLVGACTARMGQLAAARSAGGK